MTLQPADWARLSPTALATARRIASPLSLGFTLTETVAPIGITPSSARQLLNDLRDELEQLANESAGGETD
jgi:hypothetical protein